MEETGSRQGGLLVCLTDEHHDKAPGRGQEPTYITLAIMELEDEPVEDELQPACVPVEPLPQDDINSYYLEPGEHEQGQPPFPELPPRCSFANER